MPVARDQRLAAGDLAGLDVGVLEVFRDALEALGVEAGFFGCEIEHDGVPFRVVLSGMVYREARHSGS